MAEITAGIFKKYDIRGRAEGAQAVVTVEAARLVGQAFGTSLQRIEGQRSVVVGHDNRRSSPALYTAVIEGLVASGCEVRGLGLVSTPAVYWHAVQRDHCGGVMVTGSHLAPDQNGFKLSVGARNRYGEGIQALRELIAADDLAQGSGAWVDDAHARAVYLDDLAERVKPGQSLRVVIDAGNGTAGLFAPELIRRWGHTVLECLYCEPDGSYPNHQPDPSEPKNMVALGERVRELGADVGIAFDGDADRMGAVDEQGRLIAADRLLALLARDVLSRQPGAAVVADVLSSQVLFDDVAAHGGKPVMWISGHSLIKAKMVELGAPLGGEMSGHIFLGEDYYGFDDAYLVAGRLLSLLAASGLRLSELDASLPTLYSTAEYRPRCPDEAKQTVIEGVKAALAGIGEMVDVDGLRIRFPRGWGLLRASNTEPVLSLRFEGETEADAAAIRERFLTALAQFPMVESVRI
jgi:phosphomannomutase/phosphoglucomutase